MNTRSQPSSRQAIFSEGYSKYTPKFIFYTHNYKKMVVELIEEVGVEGKLWGGFESSFFLINSKFQFIVSKKIA